MCNWIPDFLMSRPQVVRIGSRTHPPLSYATLVPHRDVCSAHSRSPWSPLTALLSTALTSSSMMLMIQPSWDVLQKGSQEHFQHSTWCDDINLSLNVRKTKVVILWITGSQREVGHARVYIDGVEVERVKTLGVTSPRVSPYFRTGEKDGLTGHLPNALFERCPQYHARPLKRNTRCYFIV